MSDKKWNFDEYNWLDKYDERMQGSKRLCYKETLGKLPILCSAKRGELVLDIGMGTGNSSIPFLEMGCRVIGIEPSIKMLEKSKEKIKKWAGLFSVNLIEDPFLHIPFNNETFDIVISAYAIHHINDIDKQKAIKEMRRVSKPNGRIAIADTMFKDESHKSLALSQNNDLEDEYQPLLTTFPSMFETENLCVTTNQISDLVWIIIADIKSDDKNETT